MDDVGGPTTGILRSDKRAEIQVISPQSERLQVTFAHEDIMQQQPESVIQFPDESIDDANQSDEDDYSASVNAIIQRRVSTRRSKKQQGRRASSPFQPDTPDRRCSVFTTSSADSTAITVDENPSAPQNEIFENIKLHKEVLSNVKMQPWNMRKKLKLVEQAKSYIKKHEGQLQERLAQSHSTKDILARWNIMLIKKWQKWRRELTNMSMWFIPWEVKIKEIESHFGSVVASYFIFLRWLFWVNIVIAVTIISFVTIPEIIIADTDAAKDRKFVLPDEKYNSTNFLTLWDFEGILKYSPLFYGWYTNKGYNDTSNDILTTLDQHGYRLPFAYFVTSLVVYAYSFVATLRKMAENSRMSKLSEKDDECIFSWKLFTAWDYMIGNAETAHNRVASIVMGFREALLEEAEKKRESRNWKVICFRILVNALVVGLLSCSAYAVVVVVKRSRENVPSNIWRRNETTIVINLISQLFPMVFEMLGLIEKYHPRRQLRIQLGRIMVLNLINLYSLIFAQFNDISDTLSMNKNESQNWTESLIYTTSSTDSLTICNCVEEPVGLESVAESLTALSMPTLTTLITGTTSSTSSYIENDSTTFENSTNFDQLYYDLKGSFVDYLTFLLSFYQATTNTTINNTFNDQNVTEFDYFKSTVLPVLNITEEERFDRELRTIFNNVTTTIIPELINQITTTVESTDCQLICNNYTTFSTKSTLKKRLNTTIPTRLRRSCWETMFGQELIKITIMDLIMTGASILFLDFFRGIFVRVMNRCWCWDLEKTFPQYADFKVAENILHLVNNQGMVWMGMFFSPGLVALNVVKLYILMYLKAWTVLTCNVPHAIIFRASRSNNFYYALLLMMLFLCVLPVGYAIVWIEPSGHCGPFSGSKKIFHIFTKTIKANIPSGTHVFLDYLASPSFVIPILLLLILIIYYLISLTGALREANTDLKVQLRRERTEERRKMFQMALRRRRCGSGESNDQTPFSKWKKLLGDLPANRSCDERQESDDIVVSQKNEDKEQVKVESRGKVFFSRLIKKALGKSASDEEQNATDNEQHDSLPYDNVRHTSKTIDDDEKELQSLRNIVSKWSIRKPELKAPIEIMSESSEIVQRTDSVTSDKIPVITISNLTSDDNEVEEQPVTIPVPPVKERKFVFNDDKFHPKIKYMLKKQDNTIDEDSILHFGASTSEQELEAVFDQSNSEDTEYNEEEEEESSIDTILDHPGMIEEVDCAVAGSSRSQTDSSSFYQE